jgi:hypothetical protein
MSDIKCVVCGEPWDAYGARHGDMLPWEADLFRQGAGCPTCEGVPPEGGWEPTSIGDVENGDEDPYDRILAREAHESGTAPAWVRPQDPILWECAECTTKVYKDLDLVGSDPDLWVHAYNEEPAYIVGKAKSVEPTEIKGRHYCDRCAHVCSDCGVNLLIDATFFCDDDRFGRYPRCEDCQSVIDSEAEWEAWESYAHTDFVRDLARVFQLSESTQEFLLAHGTDGLYRWVHNVPWASCESYGGNAYYKWDLERREEPTRTQVCEVIKQIRKSRKAGIV